MPALSVKTASRTAVLVSSDICFRRRVSETLKGLRWNVHESGSGAEALSELEMHPPEAVILDSWLPDLEIGEFVREFRREHPEVELVVVNGMEGGDYEARSPRRHELLYAIRRGQDADGAIWNTAPVLENRVQDPPRRALLNMPMPTSIAGERHEAAEPVSSNLAQRLPELIGNHRSMIEIGRRVRLVAQRQTPVLIEGPTGTGKELIAQ